MSDQIAQQLTVYLGTKLDGVEQLSVTDVDQIAGGASRQTYRFQAHWKKDGHDFTRHLILRRDPPASLIDTERDLEFGAYQGFHGTGVPVPEPLWLELDEKWLDRSFFIMDEIRGGEAGNPFVPTGYGEHTDKIGEQFWTILGQIAATDPAHGNLNKVLPEPKEGLCWKNELDYWEAEVNRDTLEPQPLFNAAVRYLRNNPPPPPKQLRVVHGDYRTGNFLYNEAGDIIAILDWEMAHLGDPLEDIGWALDPLWCWFNRDRPGNMIERDEALGLWKQASGLEIDEEALAWWELFATVKGLAIWISSSNAYETGPDKLPILAMPAWWCADVANQTLLEKLTHIRGA